MKLDNIKAKTLKRDFPIFKNNPGLVYLDNAATSQRPKPVIQAITNFYERDNANVGRSTHTLAERSMLMYNKARIVASNFVGADSKEIVFTRNATEAFNLLANGIRPLIKKGKNEILLTEMEHHSNILPWQRLARTHGLKLKFVKVKPDFTLDMDDLKSKLTDTTAIISFTYVSNVLGTINPVKDIIKLAKEKEAITIIDAAQAVQHFPVDVKNLNVDFFVFSGHKMLGPTGIGVLYGRQDLLEKLEPFNLGGGMIKHVSLETAEWADIPERFEAGTQNIGEAVALAEAIKYIKKIGIENIERWEKELLKYALDKLKGVPGIEIYNPRADKSASVVSFNLKGIHPHDVAQLLNEENIAIRPGHQCALPLMKSLGIKGGVCRATLSFYNTFEDIDRLVSALHKINRKFN